MEYRHALEKIIRIIPLFLLLLLGIEFRCELFHTTLRDAPASVYPSIESSVTEKDFSEYMDDLKRASEMTGTGYFFTDYTDETMLTHTFDIYVSSDQVRKKLSEKLDIRQGEYHSLLNGAVNIRIHPLSEYGYENFKKNTSVLICGKMTEASLFYEVLDKRIDAKNPEITQADETDMVALVWIMISAFMVLLAIGYVLHHRKEVLIQEINGEDVTHIVLVSMIADVELYEAAYIIASFIMSRLVSGDYKPGLSLTIYEAGVLVAVLMNLIYLKSDVRSVFSNVTAGRGTLVFLYAVKILIFAIAVVSIAGNLENLKKARISIRSDAFPDICKTSVFFSLEGDSNTEDNWKKIYTTLYDEIRPVIDMNMTGGKNPLVLVNQYTLPLMPEDIQQLSESNSITVLAPENYKGANEDAEGILGLYVVDEKQYDMRAYSNLDIPVLKNTGIDEVHDPVIIYFPKNVTLNYSAFSNDRNIMYHISESRIKEILKNTGILVNDVVISRADTVMKYNTNFMVRLIRFLSSFCILVIIMDTVTATTMTDMQYRTRGTELAIRKVLGESLFEKNKKQFHELNISDAAIIVIAVILGILTGWWKVIPAVLTGVAIMAVENIIVIVRSVLIERTSVKKVLKGGCL